MKIYLAGPMTGHKDLNFPAFNAAANVLRELGYRVINPAELNKDPTTPWAECMKLDIKYLVDCDMLVLMEGWETSRGASLEHHIAMSLGLQVQKLAAFIFAHRLVA
jgi:nucleoside 2-deoxyribosyltransferase